MSSSSDTAPAKPSTLRLQPACSFEAIREAALAARAFLAQKGLTEEEVQRWELALVEAGNNAVEHSPLAARAQPVPIEVSCGEQDVEARITDHTPGFDWPTQPCLPDNKSESGRGLFIIQSLMDECRYLRGPGENLLLLKKKRLPPRPAKPPGVETV